MQLSQIPRIRLATLPTPLHEVPRLSEALGGPRILFKRDDLTGFAMGGNKVRKLEFLLAEALQQGADVLVTTGGPQSNHVRTTGAAARRFGLDVVGVFSGQPPPNLQGNLLLDHLMGMELVFTGSTERSLAEATMEQVCHKLRAEGRRPYLVPGGGACARGDVGYVNCVLELTAQLADMGIGADYLFCTTGSCGTQAGLIVGARWLQVGFRVCGITVSRSKAECLDRLTALAGETAELLGLNLDFSLDDVIAGDVIVYDEYLGPAYGISTPEGEEAIRLVARTEGIFLDPVYTGKAMAGLIDRIRRGAIGPDETVIFLHTGGGPGLFAHADDFAQEGKKEGDRAHAGRG